MRARSICALGKVEEVPRVMELARNQPEFKMTFDRYLEIVVSDERVKRGRALLDENRALVDRFAGPAGIPPSTVVALWGIESNYGTRLGDFEVIDALATLVYNNFRAQFFRQQLIAALKILAQGHVGLRRHEGLVGGRDGPVPVHPDQLPRLCRRRRRRWPHGHLDQQGRRLRLGLQLPAACRLEARPVAGARRCRPAAGRGRASASCGRPGPTGRPS